ncbi:hypothetical protein GQX74_000305 [Glossina fuscipes]|nr:hypothetical protein GQX74_000305 [Glossina fuscipes]
MTTEFTQLCKHFIMSEILQKQHIFTLIVVTLTLAAGSKAPFGIRLRRKAGDSSNGNKRGDRRNDSRGGRRKQAGDNVLGIEEATVVQETAQMIDEPTETSVGKLDLTNINMASPDVLIDESYNSGPSTSTHARLIKQLEKPVYKQSDSIQTSNNSAEAGITDEGVVRLGVCCRGPVLIWVDGIGVVGFVCGDAVACPDRGVPTTVVAAACEAVAALGPPTWGDDGEALRPPDTLLLEPIWDPFYKPSFFVISFSSSSAEAGSVMALTSSSSLSAPVPAMPLLAKP